MVFIITLMGNIGSGKSTLISNLKEFNVIQEPIHKWGEWLDLFYSNPSKYAFSFQMKVLMDFDIPNEFSDMVIFERSPLESKEIFAKTLLQNKTINDLEFSLLCDYHQKIAWKPNAIIYLKSPTDVCMSRINKRSRDCESGISKEYVNQLHENYESFIKNNDEIPIFEIDAKKTEDEVYSEVVKVLKLLKSAVHYNSSL